MTIRPSLISQVVKWGAYISLIILAGITLLVLRWLYAPDEVIKFNQYPIKIRTIQDIPNDGSVVLLHADYCKVARANGKVRTSFVSANREVFLPIGNENQVPGCMNTELPIIVPDGLTPDKYKIHLRADYKLNPIKHVVQEFDTEQFEIK